MSEHDRGMTASPLSDEPVHEAVHEAVHEPFVRSLDALGQWRATLEERVRDLARFLGEQGLLDENAGALLDSLRQRLAGEKLVVAFVAEFSRGKSELINAIFFADAGRRIMPASPGRTTMCPVELGWEPEDAPGLALLPIETRLEGASLTELRAQPQLWRRVPIDAGDPAALAQALDAVRGVRAASLDEARQLGFWDDEQPADNPPLRPDGQVEIPLWRHALINVPHPLLKRGLVVLDTPGLNAIGAEPELTVGLLPNAHVVVFVLGADTGVTRSDLEIWRDHLASQALTRYVVLNKIDALIDPLSPPEHSQAQIALQCEQVARTLEIAPERVFPLSARQALAGRVSGDAQALADSRLPALEQALAQQLLPERRTVLERMTLEALDAIREQILRGLLDLRRQLAEQIQELDGLRGKNSGKVRLMLQRVTAETNEFEQCTAQIQALRLVHARALKAAMAPLAGDALRRQVDAMIGSIRDSFLKLGARRSYTQLFAALREVLDSAQQQGSDLRDLLSASCNRLNTEFGFSLMLPPAPELARFRDDLALIERNYIQYLGLTQAVRLAQPRFLEQFRRMLMSRLRAVFEGAAGEIELWSRTVSGQIDAQLRERRKSFKRRRESLERIRLAADQLDTRLAELSAQDQRLATTEVRLQALDDRVRRAATRHELALPSDFSPLSRPMPLAPAAAPVPAVVTGDA
ncbi:MAG: dynamin family protein [Sphaerotilus natans]